ncbi:MAG: OmpA family protein [Bacteroidetes bacterium]|nr:OmpA family protein [Bacteroidota bacterium]
MKNHPMICNNKSADPLQVKYCYMLRNWCLLAFALFNFSLVKGQQNPLADTLPRVATVQVTVTNMKGQPRKGEEILFRGEKTGRLLTGISPANGKFDIQLPPGDTYVISVKSITDTTRYTKLVIPELGPDEFFSEPFWINIKYEPARRYRLDDVHFDTDKASLRPESYTQLNELLEYLQRHETSRVEIAGHTDNTGTEAHNLKLSQDRANAIRSYLMNKGIPGTRVVAKGYGASEPVADNTSEEGRQLNRRTEVRFL